jgi:hypothetical protein
LGDGTANGLVFEADWISMAGGDETGAGRFGSGTGAALIAGFTDGAGGDFAAGAGRSPSDMMLHGTLQTGH